MVEITRILCPVDFSECSRRALDHAVALARWYDSALTVLHVFVVEGMPADELPQAMTLSANERRSLIAELTRFVDAERPDDLPIDIVVREGNAVREILAQAVDWGADLLVMGTHGRSGFERLVLGSVTEKVLRKATCPVLSVPAKMPDAVPAGPVRFKHILCPVDFSDSALKALNYAMSLAQEADARLTVMHVLELPMEMEGSKYFFDFEEYRRRGELMARQYLRDAVPDEVRTYCSVEDIVVIGNPYREILKLAAARHSELIVMGVRGRGAADLMFFGSTTQHVVRQATCPVLTLRSA